MRHASAQVDGAASPAEPARVQVQDEIANGRTIRALSVDAPEDGRSGGPGGVFHRTFREVRDARMFQLPAATVPRPSTSDDPSPAPVTAPARDTTIVLWNELHNLPGEDGKLHPYRAIRLGGTARFSAGGIAPPEGAEEPGEGTWNNGDADGDGAFDAGFVLIGEIDYRVMLRYAEFNPVPVSGAGEQPGDPPHPELEPWRVGEPLLPAGFSAADVPAYDVDGNGTVDTTGFNGGGCHVYIVQFWTQALEEYRRDVLVAGGEGTSIHHYMPQNGYIVKIPSEEATRAIDSLACVRSLTPYHPAYRLDHELMARYFGRDGASPSAPPSDGQVARYNVQVVESGPSQKVAVATVIEAMRGEIYSLFPSGRCFSASANLGLIRLLLSRDEVFYVDLWFPPESDSDIARQISGASFLQTSPLQFRGEGVRAEVMDRALLATHEDYASPHFHGGTYASDTISPSTRAHGTSTFGINFGDGVPVAQATGMLPGAEDRIFSSWYRLLGCSMCTNESEQTPVTNRLDHSLELVDPNGPYRAVYQSNSWGTGGSTAYSNTTFDLDEAVFYTDLLVLTAQGNQGGNNSREQAWAKNVISVGGVKHRNTASRDDDCWCPVESCNVTCNDPSIPSYCMLCPSCPTCQPDVCIPTNGTTGGASTGPASDGRVKPDLVHFYDAVYAPGREQCEGTGSAAAIHYNQIFDGTSAATPITAGHAGLLFQMWHEQVFPGFGGGASVFADRPRSATAKAILLNTAYRYDWSSSAPTPNQDLTRHRQGWGMVSLHDSSGLGAYDVRNNMFIVNESYVLTSTGQVASFSVTVDGTLPLRATLVYTDPPGTTSSTLHRVNDLSLFVTAPNGTGYWGNRGLDTSNWSTSGGGYDTVNTVENVFIQSPTSGAWTVKVICHVLAADARVETPPAHDEDFDIDFALIVSGVAPQALHSPDWNKDRSHDTRDLYDFLSDFVGGTADVNADGVTNTLDIFEYVRVFLSPTPSLSNGTSGVLSK